MGQKFELVRDEFTEPYSVGNAIPLTGLETIGRSNWERFIDTTSDPVIFNHQVSSNTGNKVGAWWRGPWPNLSQANEYEVSTRYVEAAVGSGFTISSADDLFIVIRGTPQWGGSTRYGFLGLHPPSSILLGYTISGPGGHVTLSTITGSWVAGDLFRLECDEDASLTADSRLTAYKNDVSIGTATSTSLRDSLTEYLVGFMVDGTLSSGAAWAHWAAGVVAPAPALVQSPSIFW